jgi:hypothetical protein
MGALIFLCGRVDGLSAAEADHSVGPGGGSCALLVPMLEGVINYVRAHLCVPGMGAWRRATSLVEVCLGWAYLVFMQDAAPFVRQLALARTGR